VDVQNDYVLPSGALPCPDAAAIVPAIHEAAHSGFFTAGVYLSMDDKPPTADDGQRDADVPRWPAHCVSGTFGARLHEGLHHDVLPDAVIVTKSKSMSAFGSTEKGEQTPLGGLLVQRRVSHAVVCGLALEYADCLLFGAYLSLQPGSPARDELPPRYCVMETALDCAAALVPVCVVLQGTRYFK
jgi:nicotinamidase/pyrazinamidase